MSEIRVQPRSVYEHHLCTTHPNVTIHWTFSTKKKTICFGLYFKPASSTRASIDESKQIKKKRTTEDRQSNHYNSDTEDTNNSNHRKLSTTTSIYSRNRRKSSGTSVINLIDNDFTEIIPIDQVNSSKETIIGSYLAQEPGNYVLLFDNMFSRNTSKFLKLDVTTDETSDEALALNDEMSGWLLKKRRKRMQGWAKRWFELSTTGVLSYSVRKGGTKRGSIQTLLATVSVSPKQRIIHLDSGTTIFHLRALSSTAFDQWLSCIRDKRANHNIIWDEEGIQSAISIRSEQRCYQTDHHQTITKALHDLDIELKYLNNLILLSNQQQQELTVSPTDISGLPSPPPLPHSHSSSGNSLKLRFPFKRTASTSTHSDDHPTKLMTSPSSILMMERISQSIKLMTDYREKIATAYTETVNSIDRSGTAFTVHRSSSLFSYGGISDTFFDAEEEFIVSGEEEEEEESVYASMTVDSEDEEREASPNTMTSTKDLISRRTTLPHPVAIKKLSILGLLKKFIGKDLSNVPLPIMLNEPLNLLQRLCEELEYSQLLDHASKQNSSMDRLMFVTAFAISGYASTHYRLGRKPFNPLLCETFECVRPDKGFRFISEKVSHVPNTMACHASSKNFEFRQAFTGVVNFWGQSMDLYAKGQGHITLTGHEDQYSYTKPVTSSKNLLTGTKYIEHVGEMRVTNHTTGEYAIVQFLEAKTGNSFFSDGSNAMDRNKIHANFFDCRGSLIKEVEGKWNETLSEVIGPDQYAVIWRANPPTFLDPQEYYGFTQFAMELNEITSLEKDKLPITDSRYRKDQSLFENGKVAEAEDEKVRVEQLQRERRNQPDLLVPLWFELRHDPFHPDGQSWQYKGGYWEARNTGQWPKEMLQLW